MNILNFFYLVHRLTGNDTPKNGTEDDIERTESDEMADPMTGTDQTSENINDEPSSSTIKLSQKQLSAMMLEYQGEYSQFKSAEVKNI